ncbi:Protein F54D5.12 [Aphelenchoides avenae]|nr:Protein F54D5.12 [Aphelenchus avenae]
MVAVARRSVATHYAAASGVSRGDYAVLSERDLAHFESVLGRSWVKTEHLEDYNVDFLSNFRGSSKCVLLPESADQISAIVRHCYARRLAIVPQAGNTNLVGGAVPVFDEIVLSTKRLNRHYHLDVDSGILTCDAGFVLEELDTCLATDGYMMPVDLSSKGTCQIGGNVATNAGGIRLLRYGSMHGNVLGLQAVVPDESGTIGNFGLPLRKNNSDIHQHGVFVGSEGQFGVITQVSMLVAPKPTSVQTATLGVVSFENCRRILRYMKQNMNGLLASFELMDAEAVRCVEANFDVPSCLPASSDEEHDIEKLTEVLNSCLGQRFASDVLLAQNTSESEAMWKVRESIPLATMRDGYLYTHDLSLPLEHFYALTEIIRSRLGAKAKRVVTFGHLGDGNTHLFVIAPQSDKETLYPFIYDWVSKRGGSISAEHGIGQEKRAHYRRLADPTKLKINAGLKKTFDPRGILSPYKLI